MQFRNNRILILSPNYWGDMHISKHHYAIELSKLGNEVYFLNPPNINAPLIKLTKVKANLTIIDYKPIFRGQKILPNFIFQLLVWTQIQLIQLYICRKIDVLWSFTTSVFFNLKWFNAKTRIFHPVDQLNSTSAARIGEQANVIFTCSKFILNEINGVDKPKLLVPHGVSPSFTDYYFEKWHCGGEINIGYVGNLFIKNLDRKQLKETIINNKDHWFHFIGAIDPKDCNISAWLTEESISFVNFLQHSSNVVCHGIIPSNGIPEILNDMDAFLVCYKSDENNVISNSHKILEYLSTGRVVISTYVQHYKSSELIEMLPSDGSKDYTSLYSEVIKNLSVFNSIDKQEMRIAYARDNSYVNNIYKMETFISSLQVND